VGDVLLRVDGVEVSGKEASAIETLVAGPTGSPVSLTLESSHDTERRSVRLTRSETISGPFITSETQVHCIFSALLNLRSHTFC